MNKKIIFLVNVDWFFISHRLPIALAAIERGFDVYLLTEITDKKLILESTGIKVIRIPFKRSGLNIIKEISTLYFILKAYLQIRPDIVHHITIKPVIYGSIASFFVNTRNVINAISGLGYIFSNSENSVLKRILIQVFRCIFRNLNLNFIFQNKDDLDLFLTLGIIKSNENVHIIKGSGVDLDKFCYSPAPLGEKLVILFPARILWDKGVRELKIATDLLKNNYGTKIQFLIAGMIDMENKSAVPYSYILNWADGEYVKYLGFQEDMIDLYRKCDLVILPSYREGIPKALIEASASGRAIITTDSVGCRDCVDEGFNGLKVKSKSYEGIVNAIVYLEERRDLILLMGSNSRLKAEKEFDLKSVISLHLDLYNK